MNHEHDVLSQLVDYHDHISAPLVPLADDLRRGRGRVRRNRGLLAARRGPWGCLDDRGGVAVHRRPFG